MKTVTLITILLSILTFQVSAMEIKAGSDITEVKKSMKLAGYQRVWLTNVIRNSEYNITYWTGNDEAVITQHSSKTNKVITILYKLSPKKDLKKNPYRQLKTFNTLTKVMIPQLTDATQK